MANETKKPRGHFTVQLTVWCGRCHRWQYVDGAKRRLAAEQARKLGWTRTRADGFVCPPCSGNADPIDWDLRFTR